jgi:hypothetical protein
MDQDFGLALIIARSMNSAPVYSAVETSPSAILKTAAAAPAAPSDQFLQLLPGLNRSSARACLDCGLASAASRAYQYGSAFFGTNLDVAQSTSVAGFCSRAGVIAKG